MTTEPEWTKEGLERLTAELAKPLTPHQRAKFEAAAEHGLAANRGEIQRIRVGKRMKWAPMLGRDVQDDNTGIDLLLMPDGTVRWASPE